MSVTRTLPQRVRAMATVKHNEFREMLLELRMTLMNLQFLDTRLTSFIIFLAGYLLISLVYPGWRIAALLPAIAFFGVHVWMRIRRNMLNDVEQNFPLLHEKLRTAADHWDADNEIVRELKTDVMKQMRSVESAAFVNERNTAARVTIAVILCFLILFIHSVGLTGIAGKFLPQANPTIGMLDMGSEDTDNPDYLAGGPGGVSNLEVEGDLFGEANVAKLGNEELEFTVSSEGYEIDIRDVKDVRKREFDEVFPTDVGSTSAETFEENIPKEQQEIVNNYFKSLTNE